MSNSHYQKGIMAILKMTSFSESIKTLLTVNENCLQHSLELGNRRNCYYADVDSSVADGGLNTKVNYIFLWHD